MYWGISPRRVSRQALGEYSTSLGNITSYTGDNHHHLCVCFYLERGESVCSGGSSLGIQQAQVSSSLCLVFIFILVLDNVNQELYDSSYYLYLFGACLQLHLHSSNLLIPQLASYNEAS